MELWDYLHTPWLYATLTVTYVLSIITVIVVILGENRNPVKSLAWVTILILFPAVGLVLYIFFGRNIKNKRMISRRSKRRLRRLSAAKGGTARPKGLSEESMMIARLTNTITGMPVYKGNKVKFYNNGSDKFADLKADLRAARSFINLQYYIFEDDLLGREIAEILKQKAAEGVTVRVIYDHVGSWNVSSRFFSDLRNHGVEAHPFFKVTFLPLASKINWRNHRKIVVIDGRVGYIGGMNIANRYLNGGKKFELWRDCHTRIEGPAVAALQYSFARDWKFMGGELIEDEFPQDVQHTPCGDVSLQTVTGGPMSRRDNVAHVFLRAIASARKRVWVQTPYFLPPESLLRALQTASLAGVDVRIMVPRNSDSRMLNYATRSYITQCLRSGIKFYFFEPGMLHSKVLIIDDDMASTGSTNFDFRSFEHNFEGNIILYSTDANERLRNQFLDDQQQSSRISPGQWKRRPLRHRVIESIIRLLSPVL